MDLTSILLYVIIAITSMATYFLRKRLNYWKKRGIPHEEPNFLDGNMKGFRKTLSLGDIITSYYRKFKGSGPFAGIFLGQRPGVVLLEKEVIKQIMIKDFANFADRGLYYNEKTDPLTGHLFFLDGPKWRMLRTKLSPTFTSGKMKFMYPTLLKVADQFMDVLAEKVNVNPIIDVGDLLARFTTDIIGSVAFGIECNSLRSPDAQFHIMGRKSLNEQRHHPMIMNLIESFPKMARLLGMRVLPEDVHQFFMKTIKDVIRYREDHKIQRNDFLNLLIDIKNGEVNQGEEDMLTIEEMVAQAYVFFLGGFETSSSTMTFALYELAQNPKIQDRLREEVIEEFGKCKDSELTYDIIMNVPYLNQVLSETLRKYPIGSVLNRQSIEDYVVPGHPKYVIEKNTPVLIPVYGIHHDPEFYPSPENFDPDRFSPEMVKQRDAIEWLAFGSGPRNCIGMRFGQMQSRLGLATIIRHFRIAVCPKTEIPLTFEPKNPALSTKNPVYLKFEAI